MRLISVPILCDVLIKTGTTMPDTQKVFIKVKEGGRKGQEEGREERRKIKYFTAQNEYVSKRKSTDINNRCYILRMHMNNKSQNSIKIPPLGNG